MEQNTSQQPSELSTGMMLKFIVDSMVRLEAEVSDMAEMLEASSQEPTEDTQEMTN